MKHYLLPEGYLEGLEEGILAQLESRIKQAPIPKPVSWWTKAKPSLYLAASFVGLWLCFKGLDYVRQGLSTSMEQLADIEDSYLNYYEEYAEEVVAEELTQDWIEAIDIQ